MLYYIYIISDRTYRSFSRRHATVSTCVGLKIGLSNMGSFYEKDTAFRIIWLTYVPFLYKLPI